MVTTGPSTNSLYRETTKQKIARVFQSIKCALIGSIATLAAIGLIWCIKNTKAIAIVIAHPDVVAELKIESQMEVKK